MEMSSRKSTGFEIDTSGLAGQDRQMEDDGLPAYPAGPIEGKEDMTELGYDLKAYIELRGPITVHDFMSQCLNHGAFGYYQRLEKKIGKEGDFVTAPEVSQLFGELIAVWCVSVWRAMGSPAQINLVEMGPGKGTLMKDILHTARKFSNNNNFNDSVEVHMVELSPTMRELQREALECKGITPGDTKKMWTKNGNKISWHNFLSDVPAGPSIFLAQEFLDAFPVHQFLYTKKGWREMMVDVCTDGETSVYNFRKVIAPTLTPAVKLLLGDLEGQAFREGDVLEVNPLAIGAVEDVSKRISVHGGAALFVDYGEDRVGGDTLRGFRKHELVDALGEPGHIDITCDVDFGTLRSRAERAGAKVAPLVNQGEYLMRMGLVPRLEMLIENDNTTDDQAQALVDAAKMLISDDNMGSKFKVMALHHENLKVDGFED